MIEIEKDVPIPDHGRIKFPWRDMKIGDSFFADGYVGRGPIPPRDLFSQGWRFTARKEGDGVRVWRIK